MLTQFTEVEPKFWSDNIDSLFDRVSIFDEEGQHLAQTVEIADLKVFPLKDIAQVESNDPKIAIPEKFNFLPRNYDQLQQTALPMGDFVRVRATYTDSKGNEWNFVSASGDTYGWVLSSSLNHNERHEQMGLHILILHFYN